MTESPLSHFAKMTAYFTRARARIASGARRIVSDMGVARRISQRMIFAREPLQYARYLWPTANLASQAAQAAFAAATTLAAGSPAQSVSPRFDAAARRAVQWLCPPDGVGWCVKSRRKHGSRKTGAADDARQLRGLSGQDGR